METERLAKAKIELTTTSIETLERTIERWNLILNQVFADLIKIIEPIDLKALCQRAAKETPMVTVCIVDMAKAEALDSLGEGDTGVELIERYF